jgi:hypothetical protein
MGGFLWVFMGFFGGGGLPVSFVEVERIALDWVVWPRCRLAFHGDPGEKRIYST